MKRCLLLILVTVLILLLPSCGTAEIKPHDLPSVKEAEVCASAQEPILQEAFAPTFYEDCLAEKKEIEGFIRRRIGAEGFELCELWVGPNCVCDRCTEHSAVLKIVGYVIKNGKRRFLWTTSIEIPRELSDYIHAEKLLLPENPIEQRCTLGMAALVKTYLIYGEG